MNQDLRAYLYDICEACRQITEFTAGLTFEEYKVRDLVKAAV